MDLNKEIIHCELLILRCRRNDRAAWDELIALWDRRLFYYIRRIVEDEHDAWDVMQQTWLATYKGIWAIRDGRCLPKWLYRTARNLALMHRRSRHPHETWDAVEEQGPAEPSCDDDGLLQLDRADLIHHGLDHLTLPHR